MPVLVFAGRPEPDGSLKPDYIPTFASAIGTGRAARSSGSTPSSNRAFRYFSISSRNLPASFCC